MKAQPLDISLVILASNERPDPALFQEMMAIWRHELDALGRPYEVLVVDDGVGETFCNAALAVRKEWDAVRIVRFRRTFGETVALDTAVELARGRYVITSTWYMQVEREALQKSLALLDEGIHYVAGRRTPRVDGIFARMVSWVFNACTRWLTKVKLHDLNCSFRAFRKEVVEELSYHGDLFRFLGILAVRKGFRVQEIPLRHLREEGPSTVLRPGLYIRRILDILALFFLIKFTRKPLRFFGLIGVTFFLIGTIISVWMLYVRLILNQPLSERPLLVLGIFLLVLGIIVASIGLIGEIIIYTQGRNLRDYHIDVIIGGDSTDSDDHGSVKTP
jgi:glycosyltransferase involved in cell wall biosynthesis